MFFTFGFNLMLMITVQQYETVLKKLTASQLDLLIKLYHIEPAKDNAEIARQLGYKGHGAANARIGNLGKAICAILDIKPDLSEYNPDVKEGGYFIVVHQQFYTPEGESFWDMQENLQIALENLKHVERFDNADIVSLPTEISAEEIKLYDEGTLATVVINRYERDRNAREAALEKHGSICFGCDVDLKQVYGSDLRDIIEVHHLYPLNLQVEDRKTDPVTDLVPLCPNCHAAVHCGNPILTIEELRNRIFKK